MGQPKSSEHLPDRNLAEVQRVHLAGRQRLDIQSPAGDRCQFHINRHLVFTAGDAVVAALLFRDITERGRVGS